MSLYAYNEGNEFISLSVAHVKLDVYLPNIWYLFYILKKEEKKTLTQKKMLFDHFTLTIRLEVKYWTKKNVGKRAEQMDFEFV